MTHLGACKTSIDTQAFAKLLRHEVIRLRGLPYDFVSDPDSLVTVVSLATLCEKSADCSM